MKACVAEFIGTFGLLFAGTGAIMVDELSGGQVTHLGIGLTFGLIVAAMIFATGHISGAHINPAVTLAFALSRHFSWKRVPFYVAAQIAGAVAAGLTLLALLGDVSHMGATLPTGSDSQALGLEMILTFLLMFVIMAMATDARAEGSLAAIAIGATVALESTFAGPIAGASMNPARSIGPAIVGWTWTSQWLYVIGPVVGATFAALVYSWLRGSGTQKTS